VAPPSRGFGRCRVDRHHGGGVAQAAEPVASDDTSVVIAEAAPDVEIVEPVGQLDGDLVATNEIGTVAVPEDVSGSIAVKPADPSVGDLEIALPDLEGAVGATTEDDGTVVYHADDDVSLAVQATTDGVRMLSILEGPEAQDRFAYDLTLPTGAVIKLDPDNGGAAVYDGIGQPIAIIDPPWATDAKGVAVATHFELEGTTLVQVVDHQVGVYSYPIVADPSWWWWLGTSAMCAVELVGIAFGAAKVIQAFSKTEKVIQASTRLVNAYKKLGGTMKALVDTLKQAATNRGALSAAKIAALEELGKAIGTVLFNALGLGSCWALIQQI